MKRSGSSAREENYEHVLMCLICRSLFDDYDHQPKFLPCHHTFCKDCLREYIRQLGDEIECPSCRKVATIPAAGVAALQTNFYVKYIQALVSSSSGSRDSMLCSSHEQQTLTVYCTQCQSAICTTCVKNPEPSNCAHQLTKPLTTITEESHQLLDSTFAKANATIDSKKVKLETLLKGLSDEKDDALKKIDSCFEQHVHTLNRRATLLKNKVIDIFSESVEKIENDLMEISTALTCVVSLKDYHENKISQGDFKDFTKGIEEITEVNTNIEERIRPNEIHVSFENAHGADKFRMGIKDLGRVRCVRTMAPRAEPDGNDGGATQPTAVPSGASPATCDVVSSPDVEKASGDTSMESIGSSASVKSESPANTELPVQVESSAKVESSPVKVESSPAPNILSKSKSPQPPDGDKVKAKSTPPPSGNDKMDKTDKKAPSVVKTGIPISRSPTPAKATDEKNGAPKKDLGSGTSSTHSTQSKQKPVSPNTQKRDIKKVNKATNKASQQEEYSSPSQTPKASVIPAVDKNANAKPATPNVHLRHMNANFPDGSKRKADKDYYHTVYTSYDEEELLKELRATPRHEPLLEVDDDSDTLCEKQSRSCNMEDSDGWMTLSSGDENGDTIDDIVPEDELTTL